MRIASLLHILLLTFIYFFIVVEPSLASYTQSSTVGETIDTTKMLEPNDIWTHYIPVSGTARITVEMKVMDGISVDMSLVSNDAFDKYVRQPLNKFERIHIDATSTNQEVSNAIDVEYDLSRALLDALWYSNFGKNSREVYSESYSTIIDKNYYLIIFNKNYSQPSKVHLTVKYEPIFPINTEGNSIAETRTIESDLYWAHSFIGGNNKSVKISVIEGEDADFLLMDEVGFKMYTDKDSNRIVYKEQYTKFKNRSIAYDFIGYSNEKYYIVIDNTGRITDGAYSKSPIKVHLEVQEQTLPIKATYGFEVTLALIGLLAIAFLRRK